MIPFHETRMGARYIEHTVPELVRQVERLATVLERLAETLERKEQIHGPEERDEDDPQPPHP